MHDLPNPSADLDEPFELVSPEARAVVRVRSAETGETYAVLHGITGLHWLGSDAALVHQQAAHLVLGGPRLLDLATNRSHDIPGIDARVSEVFPAAPSAPLPAIPAMPTWPA